jgi:hypothetical protein
MSDRADALRLAIYLDTAGLAPDYRNCQTWDEIVAALSLQFFSLPAEVRRDAKTHAAFIMGQGGLMEVGHAILSDHPFLNEIRDNTCQPRRPRCEHCRKATWDSRDAVVQFCRANSMAHLRPFECPIKQGKWHIAGRKEPEPQSAPREERIETPDGCDPRSWNRR